MPRPPGNRASSSRKATQTQTEVVAVSTAPAIWSKASAPSTSDSIRLPDRNGKAAEVGGGKRSSRSAAVGSGTSGMAAT